MLNVHLAYLKASEKGEERRGIKGRQDRKDLERGKKRTVGDARKSEWRMERKKKKRFFYVIVKRKAFFHLTGGEKSRVELSEGSSEGK